MWSHPLVQFWMAINMAFFLMQSQNFRELSVFIFILSVGILYLRIDFKHILKKISAYFIYLPLMLVLYVFFSIVFASQSLIFSIQTGLLALIKFFSLVFLMSSYLEYSNTDKFLDSIRSIWVKTGLSWEWVDHLFTYFYLILRFYPDVQMEWDNVQRAQKGLNMPEKGSKIGKMVQVLTHVPELIVSYVKRSDTMANVMKKRGYGNNFPRGISEPIPFEFGNLFALVLVTLFLAGANATL